jgi:hypothetical protein
MGKQSASGAGLDARVGHRRERQERDRRIDALAVGVLVAIGEREAAERREGELLQTMVDREQVSLRPAVAVARRHDQPRQRQPTSRTRAARPEWMWLV